jgi:hypothetical protein
MLCFPEGTVTQVLEPNACAQFRHRYARGYACAILQVL